MFYQVPRVSREGMAIARRHVSNLWRSTHRPLTGAFALASRGPAARGVGLDGRPRIPTPPSPAVEQTALPAVTGGGAGAFLKRSVCKRN